MLNLGRYNKLRAIERTEHGMYLADNVGNDVLLPNKYVPEDLEEEDEIEVFLYRDFLGRKIATTLKPKIKLNQFAYLEVFDVTDIGAFVEWGLEKHLLIPFRQMKAKPEVGDYTTVYMYLDEETNRLVGSTKIRNFLDIEPLEMKVGDEVDLYIWRKGSLGYFVIINNQWEGLLYHSEVYKHLHIGETQKGYISRIREDGKTDVSLRKFGYAKVESDLDRVLEAIADGDGFLDLNDKSDPKDIQARLQMSKKTFKKAIGALYKSRKIRIESDGIYLVKKDSQ